MFWLNRKDTFFFFLLGENASRVANEASQTAIGIRIDAHDEL